MDPDSMTPDPKNGRQHRNLLLSIAPTFSQEKRMVRQAQMIFLCAKNMQKSAHDNI
jgi:hypothetical protein